VRTILVCALYLIKYEIKFPPQVTRAYIHMLMTHKESSGCALLTVHNVAFQLRLMRNIRQAIKEDRWVDIFLAGESVESESVVKVCLANDGFCVLLLQL